jgi:hypothetical protein
MKQKDKANHMCETTQQNEKVNGKKNTEKNKELA